MTGQQGLPRQHTSTPSCKTIAASGTPRQLYYPLHYELHFNCGKHQLEGTARDKLADGELGMVGSEGRSFAYWHLHGGSAREEELMP